MILYDFECRFCGKKIEALIKVGDANPKCPACGKQMVKIISAVPFILKGGNWAKDNYGLKKNKKG